MAKITQQKIAEQARSWLGTRWHHQGRLKKSTRDKGGVDCIGLVIGVMRELEMYDAKGEKLLADYDRKDYSALPDGHRLRADIEVHFRQIDTRDMRPGDLLLLRFQENPQHVGFVTDYVHGGLGIIHCHARAKKVVEHDLSDKWRKLIVAAYRFRPEHLRILKDG